MNPPRETYLDHAASAPLRPEARAAILAALDAGPGNAGSAHAAGRRLRRLLSEAREAVAELVSARPEQVVFTSGTTESNRLGVRGLLGRRAGASPRLVTTSAAHDGLRALARALSGEGIDAREAVAGPAGHVSPDAVAGLAGAGPAVVAVSLVQSVTGARQPVAEIAAALPGAAIHVDAAQAVGRLPVSLDAVRATTLALSAHKLGGPQGIGALVVRDDADLVAPDGAAAQERGRRAGTEAVALAAGFGAAARAAAGEAAGRDAADAERLVPLHNLCAGMPGVEVLSRAPAVAGIVLLRCAGCPGDAVLAALDAAGVRVSTGTACASGARTPPYVLTAAGLPAHDAAECVRISTGWSTTRDDVERLVDALRAVLPRVRTAFASAAGGQKKSCGDLPQPDAARHAETQ